MELVTYGNKTPIQLVTYLIHEPNKNLKELIGDLKPTENEKNHFLNVLKKNEILIYLILVLFHIIPLYPLQLQGGKNSNYFYLNILLLIFSILYITGVADYFIFTIISKYIVTECDTTEKIKELTFFWQPQVSVCDARRLLFENLVQRYRDMKYLGLGVAAPTLKNVYSYFINDFLKGTIADTGKGKAKAKALKDEQVKLVPVKPKKSMPKKTN